MPELPEVELVRRGLAATVLGRRLERVHVLWPGSLPAPQARLERLAVGRRLTAVRRRGKLLLVDLEAGSHLLVHPMMTGQLVVVDDGRTLFAGGHPSRSMLEPMPNVTTRVVFALEGERRLYFNDGRKFGRIRLVDDDELAHDPFLARLGPEPLDNGFTLADFRSQLERHAYAPVKAVLLDQTVVAGIGNIYADEALHRARIHPRRPAGSLSPSDARRLHDAILETLTLALACGGTSVATADAGLGRDGYLSQARVFRRQGQPCPVCGTTIERTRVAGRGTNVCPRCQPTPESAGADSVHAALPSVHRAV